MRELAGMAVALRDGREGVRAVDLSCGRCPECASGAALWCLDRREDGPDLVPTFSPRDADRNLSALLAASALLEAPAGAAVLVVEAEGSPLARLAQRLGDGRRVVVGEPAEASVRGALAALDHTGRARRRRH